ncbi:MULTISPECIES: PH domain-containing protein [Sutcliffiella]|uniref:Uncharacterized protein YyaB-like PH domain-containing protein n=1 Tax=Sutcliffiella cohnii TaxID=33932 RepID=A0A223KRB6_9BACI|nr:MULTISPECIES: PH domain-containing protein [Sutcliffiella]AST91894.1 hypothetical protein BC6307_11700 [Sutcliffiella cohnii]WBL13123.1 PH domain-containing protein [Sutcliffiella sp. NC1]
MLFRSKVDTFFGVFIFIAIAIIGAVTILPIFLDEEIPKAAVIILISSFFFSVGLILWPIFYIKYMFTEDYLLVRGGPFRSKIVYEDMTKVSRTRDIFTGYRILSSRDALEISYKTSMLGSVKISPKDEREFLKELQKHCPHLTIDL